MSVKGNTNHSRCIFLCFFYCSTFVSSCDFPGCGSPGVGCLTVRPILLHVHAKETHVHTVNLLKHKHGLAPVGELLGELSQIPLLHEHASLQGLVRGGHHTDGDRPRLNGVGGVDELGDPFLQESRELGSGETCRHVHAREMRELHSTPTCSCYMWLHVATCSCYMWLHVATCGYMWLHVATCG